MASRIFKQCVICKKKIPDTRYGKDTCSQPCGVEKFIRIAEQMRNKKGKFYRKWLDGSKQYRAKKRAEKRAQKRKQ